MLIRTAGLFAAACLALFAQPSAPPGPEAPTWPGQEIPKALEKQYVFVSPERDALVIRVPPDSEYARRGKPTIVRYDLHNRLKPRVTVQLGFQEGVGFLYRYSVANAASASDSIGAWWLVVPVVDSEKPTMSCAEWCGGLSVPPIFRQVELPDQPRGRVIMWARPNGEKLIQPSESWDHFRIESSCRPGFTTALFSSENWVNIDQDLPDEVFKQMAFYNDPTWAKVPVLTFGPMFCSGSSRQVIAQNMISGTKRLIETHVLDPNSEFVRDVLRDLELQLRENASEPAMGHPPSGQAETELAKALELSLSFRLARR